MAVVYMTLSYQVYAKHNVRKKITTYNLIEMLMQRCIKAKAKGVKA
jgi:hypothetical protein